MTPLARKRIWRAWQFFQYAQSYLALRGEFEFQWCECPNCCQARRAYELANQAAQNVKAEQERNGYQ